ncbi:MAG: thiamine phosphate synthase [Acidobacteria bacterium]|nr:thiamine phosphate synthase [Acidobacteriota bacterium]
MRRSASPGTPGICFVTDRGATEGRPLIDVARAAIAGGADVVQLREKDLEGGALLALARELVEAARTAGGRCRVIVNDRLDVALAAKAAGVHLPSDGLPIEGARRCSGKRFLIGRSVHSLAEARQAAREGAHYLFFGPIFATPSKTPYGPPQGTDALRRVVDAVEVPVWAIGGISPGTAGDLRGIRIAGVAVISAIAAAPDPAEGVRALRSAL